MVAKHEHVLRRRCENCLHIGKGKEVEKKEKKHWFETKKITKIVCEVCGSDELGQETCVGCAQDADWEGVI